MSWWWWEGRGAATRSLTPWVGWRWSPNIGIPILGQSPNTMYDWLSVFKSSNLKNLLGSFSKKGPADSFSATPSSAPLQSPMSEWVTMNADWKPTNHPLGIRWKLTPFRLTVQAYFLESFNLKDFSTRLTSTNHDAFVLQSPTFSHDIDNEYWMKRLQDVEINYLTTLLKS